MAKVWLLIVKKGVGKMLLTPDSSEPGREKQLQIKTLPMCFALVPDQASLLLHPWIPFPQQLPSEVNQCLGKEAERKHRNCKRNWFHHFAP